MHLLILREAAHTATAISALAAPSEAATAAGAGAEAGVEFEGAAEALGPALAALLRDELDILEASLAEMADGSPDFSGERERGYVEFPVGGRAGEPPLPWARQLLPHTPALGLRGFAFPARPYAWALCRWERLGGTTALLSFPDRDAWVAAAATAARLGPPPSGLGQASAPPAGIAYTPSSPPRLPTILCGALRACEARVLLVGDAGREEVGASEPQLKEAVVASGGPPERASKEGAVWAGKAM
jgi:hypothetical protein